MSRQFKRKIQVIIGKQGSGLLVEDLRINFEITKTLEAEPNCAIIKIFNLNPDNESKIKNEFDEVIVNAGYEADMRLVFLGNIKHVYRYRDKSDFITEIEAGDGDKDFRNSVMNETLAAGTTDAQIVDKAVKSFGTTKKGQVQLSTARRIRGKVITGNTRDVLKNLSNESNTNWSIQDGQLQIVKVGSVLADEAIVVNSETGMLSSPEVNDKGISAKCLLNPQIKVNGRIKLDNNTIKAKREKNKTLATDAEKKAAKKVDPVRLDPDGFYKVVKLIHVGDNRGQDWYTEIECLSIGQNK